LSNERRYEDDNTCFACGRNNPHGLQLPIVPADDGVALDWSVPARYTGWRDVVHGGIVSTILDELLAWACTRRGTYSVTAELTVRFRRPLQCETPFRGFGRVTAEKGRVLFAESRITLPDGTLVAEATGKLMKV
jgi:uncharacterized protein (TIGR00369 family)